MNTYEKYVRVILRNDSGSCLNALLTSCTPADEIVERSASDKQPEDARRYPEGKCFLHDRSDLTNHRNADSRHKWGNCNQTQSFPRIGKA